MEKLNSIITNICANNSKEIPHQIVRETRLRKDLGFDSFDLAELTVHVEEAFGVDIFEDGIVETIGDICKKLNI